jgi:segregation and condensation protein B
MEDIKHIIESLLFVAEEPLTVDKIKRITVHAETGEIREALRDLSTEYESRRGGFYLDEVAGGFQIRTRPEYNEWIRKMIQPRPLRLSKAALETLVIIAYKQPIIRSDIEHLRGVDCGGVLRVLLERKLIRVLGRREIAGRPLIYATTKRFLEVFDLKDLKDLPTPREIEELGASLTESGESIPLDSEDEAGDESADTGAAGIPQASSENREYGTEAPEKPETADASESQNIADDTSMASEAPPPAGLSPAPPDAPQSDQDTLRQPDTGPSPDEPR